MTATRPVVVVMLVFATLLLTAEVGLRVGAAIGSEQFYDRGLFCYKGFNANFSAPACQPLERIVNMAPAIIGANAMALWYYTRHRRAGGSE